mmetsp:Transcript_10423/g.15905  ORF Transcript_10423/g.15905 Transcript_10423/m.15905 type:complete len:200 (+) Transcript_10423:770-1369(+)
MGIGLAHHVGGWHCCQPLRHGFIPARILQPQHCPCRYTRARNLFFAWIARHVRWIQRTGHWILRCHGQFLGHGRNRTLSTHVIRMDTARTQLDRNYRYRHGRHVRTTRLRHYAPRLQDQQRLSGGRIPAPRKQTGQILRRRPCRGRTRRLPRGRRRHVDRRGTPGTTGMARKWQALPRGASFRRGKLRHGKERGSWGPL